MKALLIVEDDEAVREGLAAVLRREGYAVEALADGRLAMDRLLSRRPT